MRKFLLLLPLLFLLFWSGCSSRPPANESIVYDFQTEADVIHGTIGETMHTTWFDFTVNSTKTAAEYGGMAAEENTVYLVADITVENTFTEDVPMYDADFMLLWTDGFDIPLDPWTDTQFPPEYVLKQGETVQYDAVYQVPVDGLTVPTAADDRMVTAYSAGGPDLAIYFWEYFEDDTRGSQYCVSVSPEDIDMAEAE